MDEIDLTEFWRTIQYPEQYCLDRIRECEQAIEIAEGRHVPRVQLARTMPRLRSCR